MKKLQVEISEEYYATLNPDECVVTAEFSGIDKAQLALLTAEKKDCLKQLGNINKQIEAIWDERT